MIKIENFRGSWYSIKARGNENMVMVWEDEIIELYGLLAPIAAEIVNQRVRADKTEPKKNELD